MTTGPDLSSLSEAELRAIELGSNEQLNELALRLGRVKSPRPSWRSSSCGPKDSRRRKLREAMP